MGALSRRREDREEHDRQEGHDSNEDQRFDQGEATVLLGCADHGMYLYQMAAL